MGDKVPKNIRQLAERLDKYGYASEYDRFCKRMDISHDGQTIKVSRYFVDSNGIASTLDIVIAKFTELSEN